MQMVELVPSTRRAARTPSREPSIALFGAALWTALWLMTIAVEGLGVSSVELLLVFAALVVVPLGFSLPLRDGGTPPRALLAAQPAAALALSASVFLPPGPIATLLAAPWAVVGGIAALGALGHIRTRRGLHSAAYVHAAALVYLFLGSATLLAARAGLRPFGLAEATVGVAAVHYHFVGFGAGILAAGLLTAIGSTGPAWVKSVSRGAAGCLVLAVALTAFGIATSSQIELAGNALLAVSISALGTLGLVLVAPTVHDPGTRALMMISGLSAFVATAALLDHAFGPGSQPAEGITAATGIYGLSTAFGFVFAGLWALRRLLELPRNRSFPSP
ncbi:MAG TPA: YndJ family transporter [Actinomycetota bacterium]|jgi:hypothetical protein|nr:YndJ family transporter [Actinomycetota bacterium]